MEILFVIVLIGMFFYMLWLAFLYMKFRVAFEEECACSYLYGEKKTHFDKHSEFECGCSCKEKHSRDKSIFVYKHCSDKDCFLYVHGGVHTRGFTLCKYEKNAGYKS